MKKTYGICMVMAMAVFAASPVVAAGPMLDQAVALAAQDSGARLSDICYSVYKAVKEAPEEADEVFSQVISQRTTWAAGEIYAIFRAVLLARPDLEEGFRTQVASYRSTEGIKGKDGEAARDAMRYKGKDGESGDAARDAMLYKLMGALHEASLSEGVVPAVLNALMNNAIDLAVVNQAVVEGRTGGSGISSGEIGVFETPSITPPGADIPSDADMSGQNRK